MIPLAVGLKALTPRRDARQPNNLHATRGRVGDKRRVVGADSPRVFYGISPARHGARQGARRSYSWRFSPM